jgi:hypothetical protein
VPSATDRPASALRPAPLRHAARWSAVAALVLIAGCSGASDGALKAVSSPAGATAVGVITASPDAAPPADDAATRGRPAVEAPVAELTQRRSPDVLLRSVTPFSDEVLGQLKGLSEEGASVSFRAGTLKIGEADVPTVAVDPSTYRAFAAEGTAEATAVWQSVARGEAVTSHALAKTLSLQLGGELTVTGATGAATPLRLGALATTGVPSADLIVDDSVGAALGLAPGTGVLLSARADQDPKALADEVRAIAGDAAVVDLLRAPAANPVAFLTGSKAAQAFGKFSYRYFPDGTIQPDAAWVQENIVTTTVPIMGRVTCHRLMIPQLRGALQEVVDAGLAHTLKTYDGCYVPRFIERNPENSISLHTWGIAIDMDAATNYRGIRGTMDQRVADIFKRWGFRWGGDWTYTDPMHFELGALLDAPKR